MIDASGVPEALVGSFSLATAEILDSNITLQFVTMSLLIYTLFEYSPKIHGRRKFAKCTTYACDTVRTIFFLEPCIRRREVSRAHKTKTLRAVTKLKGEGNNGTWPVSSLERNKRYTGSKQVLHSV